MPTRVKICGITRAEDARLAIELGAAALGFNFYPPSPRYIAPGDAAKIIREVPPLVTCVGIFAEETDAASVAGVAREAGVAALQLHAPGFPPDDAHGEFRGLRLIRALAVREDFRPEELGTLKADGFLLDAYDSKLIGGTGRSFDWNLAREAKRFGTIILAGGLTPENVGEAIRQARPFAVDVASGVESAPGKKDPAKLRAFFAAVQDADSHL